MAPILTIPFLGALIAFPGDFDIVVNEIHYHPFGNNGGDEFIELYNRGPLAVDLSGWRLDGAVVLSFPVDVVLRGGEYLVLSPEPARTVQRYGVPKEQVVGPWAGQLDNDGEALLLENAAGTRITRVRYRDGAGWPEEADGFGPSLELVSPRYDFDYPEKWAASARPGGTPGYLNSRWFSDESSRDYLVDPGGFLRFFRGTEEPSPAEPFAWTRKDFDDGGWEEGPGPIGYGDPGIGTELDDMRGSYTSAYARFPFTLGEGDLDLLAAGSLSLQVTVQYDDGFVAYVEGAEAFRINAPGAPGEVLPHDAVAPANGESSTSFDLAPVSDRLVEGGNVLAIQGFNRDIQSSSDFFIGVTIVRIERTSVPEGSPRGPLINEVSATGPVEGGFIEIVNPTSRDLNLEGFKITWDPYDPAGSYVFPAGTVLVSGGLLAVDSEALSFVIPLEEGRYILLDREGNLVAGLDAQLGPLVSTWGLFPDGGGEAYALTGPTPEAPNQVDLQDAVVINEIHYHPPDDPDDPEKSARQEFIELYNRSDGEVVLTGWRFSRGIDYAFEDGAKIPPHGFLVVAARPEGIRELPGLPEDLVVVGGFDSRLTNDAETIRLDDPLGNPADQVRYADDGTWPQEADGDGPSLELVNPLLANEAGGAWRAGPPGGTPGAPNASLDPEAGPVVYGVRHDPPVPRVGDPILVVARASALGTVVRVTLSYTTQHGTGSGDVELHDDGLNGDGHGADGIWSGIVPAPVPDGPSRPARVVFSVTARDDGNRAVTVPGGGNDFLLEVDDQEYTGNSQPRYRLIMTDENWNQLRTRGSGSNVNLDATFIGDGEIFYNVGLHYRGQSARSPGDGRYSYRINLRDEHRFHGIRKLNLNAQNIWRQILGNDFIHRSGIQSIQFWPANVWIDGQLDRGYLRVEALDSDYLNRNFSSFDAAGNLYRGQRGGGGRQGKLSWYGEDPSDYMDIFDKITNVDEGDWSDIMHLCDVLSNTPDDEYADAVRFLVDVEEWCRYFAIYSALGSTETGIYRDDGDDYFLYRRPSDGRWMLFPWDQDSDFSLSEVDQVLFRPSPNSLPSVYRFLTHPDVAPIYYCILEELAEGPFARRSMEYRYPLISDIGGPGAIAQAQEYVTGRLEYLGEEIPVRLTAGVTATGHSSPVGTLVDTGDVFQYFKGRDDPPGSWMEKDFDDTGWESGPTPMGHGYDPLGTSLDSEGNYTTIYGRREFAVSDPASFKSLNLHIGYDDGFVAFLNGIEVARNNLGSPGDPVPADSRGVNNHDAYPREAFAVDPKLLQQGKNVLAVVVANNRVTSTDFLLDPVLMSGAPADEVPGGGCGSQLHGAGNFARLEGTAPGCGTRTVLVNGQPAEFFPVGARWRADVQLIAGTNPVTVEALDGSGDAISTLELKIETGGEFQQVEGSLAGGASWSKEEGPYYVAGDLDVPQGARLAMGPGTRVMIAPGASITVRGELDLEGSPDDPVLLQPVHCGETWDGIRILDSGMEAGSPQHRILNASLLGAGAGGNGTALEVRAARVEVKGVDFHDLEGVAIQASDAWVDIEDCRFRDVPGALQSSGSSVMFRSSEIQQSTALQPALLIEGDGAETTVLEELDVTSPVDLGVALRDSSAILSQCRIHDSSGAALQVEGGSPKLFRLILVRSGTGLLIQGGTILCDHLTITENPAGIDARGGAEVSISSSIIWGNGTDARSSGASMTFSFSDSDLGSGEPPAGEGNIAADPLFASRESFELAGGSPAARTGKDGTDMGAVSSPGAGPTFVRGDYKEDDGIDLTDAIAILGYEFLGTPPERCLDAADTDDSGALDLTDVIYLLSYMFTGGKEPPPPFQAPGPDPTPDSIPCNWE